ncbi:unnamed protein product [Cuscuta campestris]|uniref:RNase H type-1 domain-containing protein n=1 Tax=Cuscuta campestris TaxID=132261 RepID=A0A484L9Y5_9ASTE|nr:unnamed protein product [Cuscuta campestris]
MPLYAMSVFLLPRVTCQRIERLLNSFWWESKGINSSGIHWMSWQRLSAPKKFGGLGFKQIREFNVAMIGKQGWRLLTKPEALVTKVFKAMYFPKTSFLEAQLGSNPSYCWRSILEAKNLISNGVRKRIGDGSNTLVWGDPWLADRVNPFILTPRPPFMPNLPVCFLLNHDAGGWNLEVVQSLFCPRDVDQISRVPLQLDSEDKWYWAGETHGEYSVKEAYRRLVGEATSTPDFSRWGQIWQIPIAPKIRICLWRTIRNILPVKVALITKGVEIEIECPVCGGAAETIDHIFLQCPLAIGVWNLLGWSRHLVQTESLVEWMEYQFSKLSIKELKLVAEVIWAIWRARNKAVWDHYIPSPQSVVSWIIEVLLEPPNKTGQSGRQESMQVSPRSEHRVFRCYVDAAIFPSSKEVAFGSVIFDPGGSFYAAINRMMQCPLEPVIAEAMACREALTWARANEIQDMELLTDCRWVAEALCERNIQVFSYLGTIIKDCKALLAQFNSALVAHIPREDNGIAHTLARSAITQSSTWNTSPPDCISHLLE